MYSLLFVVIIIYKSIWYPISIKRTSEELIYKGVYINEYDVGGLSKEEAVNNLSEKLNKKTPDKKIKLWNGNAWDEIKYTDTGFFYPLEKTVEEAIRHGKENKGIVRKTLERVKVKLYGRRIRVNALNDEDKLNDYIKKLSDKMNTKPVDAKIVFDNKSLVIINEVKGRKIDEVELRYCIRKAILFGEEEISIPFKITIPKITANMLSCSYSNLSSFSTPLLSKNADRTNNIKIAASNINGDILYPGEIFSANKAIGKRTVEKGYRNAPIFQGGKVVPGLAGGICQLVTTIYNTALNANLQIVERTRHGQPVSYVARGMDATIAGDAIDLKFKNTSKHIIFIHTYVDKNNVTVNFYKININRPDNKTNMFYFKTNNYLLRKTSEFYTNESI
jgi:vancomycin resistance protein YoaR